MVFSVKTPANVCQKQPTVSVLVAVKKLDLRH